MPVSGKGVEKAILTQPPMIIVNLTQCKAGFQEVSSRSQDSTIQLMKLFIPTDIKLCPGLSKRVSEVLYRTAIEQEKGRP